jgi:hypothetical protein
MTEMTLNLLMIQSTREAKNKMVNGVIQRNKATMDFDGEIAVKSYAIAFRIQSKSRTSIISGGLKEITGPQTWRIDTST